MNNTRIFYIIIICLLNSYLIILSGCFHRPDLSPENALANSEAILIIGVESSPPVHNLSLSYGLIKGENWYRPFPNPNFVIVMPKNGYIIAKLKPTDHNSRYIISSFNYTFQHGNFRAQKFDKAFAFEAISKKILYPGTIVLNYISPNSINASFIFQPDKATEFIKENYPHLTQYLEFKQMISAIVAKD